MSVVAAINNSSQLASLQANYQEVRKEFAQLGQDLSAGNLTQAQADFVTLSQAASSQFGSNSPIGKGSRQHRPGAAVGRSDVRPAGVRFSASWTRAPKCSFHERSSSSRACPAAAVARSTRAGAAVRQSDGGSAGIHGAAAKLASDVLLRRGDGADQRRYGNHLEH